MKILYIHQYFSTNEGTGGTRSYDVARHFVKKGHAVTVVTGLSDGSGLEEQPWWLPFRTRVVDGVKVVICNTRYANKMKVAARLLSFAKFALQATLVALWERDVDVIFATSTPLSVGIPARMASALRHRPYVFEVRDLWPEDLLAAGRMKPGIQHRLCSWVERMSYAKAARIVLVSRGFHDRLLERGLEEERLATIPLGADGELFARVEPDHGFIEEQGLAGKVVAVYAGALGDANGLLQVLDAAEHLRDRPDIAVLVLGEGKMRGALEEAIRARSLSNVHLAGPVPKYRLPAVLAGCHMGLMILKQISRPRWVTPNKLFDYMFSGLPVLVNFAGTTADLVASEGIGFACVPGDAGDLAAKIRRLADRPEERVALGERARQVGYAKFDRRAIASELLDLLHRVVEERR